MAANKKVKAVPFTVYRDTSGTGRFVSSPKKKAKASTKKSAKKPAKKPANGAAKRRAKSAAQFSEKAQAAGAAAKKAKKDDVKAVQRLRSASLKVRAMEKRGGLSKKAQELAKAHGILRVNPGYPLMNQLKTLSKDLLVSGAAAWTVSKVGCMVKERSEKSQSAFVQKYGVTMAVGGATAAAFLAARSVAPRYASSILMGGVAATAIHALVAVKNAEGVSMGRRLFPSALQGYVPVGSASAEESGSPYSTEVGSIPSVEDFANPTALSILEESTDSGSLSGSIF